MPVEVTGAGKLAALGATGNARHGSWPPRRTSCTSCRPSIRSSISASARSSSSATSIASKRTCPKTKRVFGYFACPVLVGDRIVAALDLKTDRERRKLLLQHWTWIGTGGSRRERKRAIEEALHRFERFQLAS